MVKKGRILFSFYFFFFFASSFAFEIEETLNNAALQQTIDFSNCILSPVPGKWANYQSLILELPKDCIALYSFTGEDPLDFGFAYDGPVLIQKEGEVDLRIVFVLKDNTEYEIRRKYFVSLDTSKNNTTENSASEKEFLNYKERLLVIDEEHSVDIPSSLFYSLNDYEFPFIKGRSLDIGNNDVERYIPLIVESNKNLYRWMLYIGKLNRNSVSEEIALNTRSAQIVLKDLDFQFRLKDSKNDLADVLWLSLLPGEEFSKEVSIDVFYQDDFKGSLTKNISLSNEIPKTPQIISSTRDFYSREAVHIEIAEEGNFYYLIEEPLVLQFDESSSQYLLSETLRPSPDLIRKGIKVQHFELEFPCYEEAVLYRVHVLAEAKNGNLSDIASYECIIDSNNFFVDARKQDKEKDSLLLGRPERPFTSLEDALEALKTKDFAKIHLLSNDILNTPIYIHNNLIIKAHNNAQLGLGKNAHFEVEGADLLFYNIFFVYNDTLRNTNIISKSRNQEFFSLKNSRLLFDNCDFNAQFSETFDFIEAIDSNLDIFNSSIALKVQPDSTFLSLADSNANLLSSNISLEGNRALMFAFINSSLTLYESKFTGIGEQFKFADLINSSYYFVSNNFYNFKTLNQMREEKNFTKNLLVKEFPIDLFFIDFKSKQKEFLNNTIGSIGQY